jgi:hypothetical protein
MFLGQYPGVLLQALNAEDFSAQRLLIGVVKGFAKLCR